MTDIPGGFGKIQEESIAFNQPDSSSAMTAIGSSINGLLSLLTTIGDTKYSVLTEPQLQAHFGNPNPATWVLADGRDVTGSAYQTVTGNTNIPDLRGIFVRSVNNGGSAAGTRTDAYANPLDPTGSYNPNNAPLNLDSTGQHQHTAGCAYTVGGLSGSTGNTSEFNPFGRTVGAAESGTATPYATDVGFVNGEPGQTLVENAPKNSSLACYIRIN